MKTPDLNRTYRCLFESTRHFPESIADVEDLAREAQEANAELSSDIELFMEMVDRVEWAMNQSDENERRYALVRLRSQSLNIATLFNNLVTSIEDIAFAKQVAQYRTGKPIYQLMDVTGADPEHETGP